MKLKTMRRTFKKYGKDLTISGEKKSISFPKISYVRPKIPKFNKEPDFEKALDKLIFRFKRHKGFLLSPCIVCGCETNIEIHHIRKLKDVLQKKD